MSDEIELPGEILMLICEELGNQLELGTLFSCALSGKSLAYPAFVCLYRVYNQAAVNFSENQNAYSTNKWASLWKSVIESSLGNTLFPYCLYIRALDLRNLKDLLEDQFFREGTQDKFFAGGMGHLKKAQDTPIKRKTRKNRSLLPRIDTVQILNDVGEAITSFISNSASSSGSLAALDELSGHITSDNLSIWTSRLSKLKTMTLWDGTELNENVATSIANNCYGFDDLALYSCLPKDNMDVDEMLASFFFGLRSNSLRSFSSLNAGTIGPPSLLALCHHSSSLKKLEFNGLKSSAIMNLNLLQACTALESLDIVGADKSVDLEATENDVFLEVVEWLGSCEHLFKLRIAGILNSPSILTQVCLCNGVHLRHLKVHDYPMVGNQDFHRALSHQTTLEELDLKADPEGDFRDDIDTLIESISRLPKLKDLRLLGTSDYFRSSDIIKLAYIGTLEKLCFGGYDVGDDIWHAVARLHNLKGLQIQAMTSFTSDGILAFISSLGQGNRGLELTIDAQNQLHDLKMSEQAKIRTALINKVGPEGRFVFQLYRETDEDSDELSD
ncbi:hypothetical protein BGZ60DRAFT_368488 [Tricladium varicosporioides]|nr:hypothetical protein BGZ60DRAFT_368488 [Hymenoscyphus varicosporioides]